MSGSRQTTRRGVRSVGQMTMQTDFAALHRPGDPLLLANA